MQQTTQSLLEPTVIAAIISGVVAVLGVLVSSILARGQTRIQAQELELRTRELDFRAKELENFAKQLEAQLEENRQAQLVEIIKKRIETYPQLWSVLLTYGRNWRLEGKVRDAAWAQEFLLQLNKCHAEFGVFFSQPVYAKFHEFQNFLKLIAEILSEGKEVYQEQYVQLFRIINGDQLEGTPGLATHLKNDLGSYSIAAIQRAKAQPLDDVLS